ncbi:hypothetical protein [Janthinobacterium sp. 17J80-10]|uniref:hypothetical protein n=1 Tax=Janthinobacterium sp. 17J80-10 TaxID=2497863 RepID=UPI00100562AE|nr:hypothetical protein [Janthinobacterium sp. 17J80-10]QAU34953.1 hypothetical protein EKL02_12600 [Janthinobacterium sp. 17J80-10]
MKILIIKDLSSFSQELEQEAMAAVHGGRMKLPFQRASVDNLLTSPQGDPVAVYVDGVLVNSVSTGYAPR